MKSSTALLVGSLALNLGLVGLFNAKPQFAPPRFRGAFVPGMVPDASAQPAVPKRTPTKSPAPASKLGPALVTDDLAALVSQLRARGFPAGVIREIVRAEVGARYNPRLRALSDPDPNTPFWQLPSRTFEINTKRLEEMRALELERSKLLRTLLSDEFFATGEVTAAQRRQFGNLPRQKIDAVQRIEDDYAEMTSAIRAGMNGVTLPEDAEKLALLTREKHADLATVLNGSELSEYEMRSSPLTGMLRGQFGEFRPNEAEYRAIFQAQSAYSEKFAGNLSGGDMNERREAHQKVNEQVRAALGESRFAEYLRETSSEYQNLKRLVARENLPAETALRAYGVRDTVSRESNRIYDDPALTVEQKIEALRTLAQTTRTQLLATLGPVAGPAYVATADSQWLRGVERGSALTFTGGPLLTMSNVNATITLGASASYRTIAQPRPAPNP
jgi:hypothetical protein